MDRNLINYIIGIVVVFLVLGVGYLIKTMLIVEDEAMKGCFSEYEGVYYELLARKNKNPSLCDKIVSADKEYCKAVVNKNKTYCQGVIEEAKMWCEKQILKDPSFCEQNEYFCLAEYAGNPEYCNSIEKRSEKEECIARAKLDADYFVKNKKKLCKEVMKETEQRSRQ